MITSYIYNKSIETIWKEVRDTSSLNNIISSLKPDFATEPVLLNCNNTYEKNASFFFYVNKQYKLLYKVKEIIETDYYCKISCKMYSSVNKDQAMSKCVHLHYLGLNKTQLIYERNCALANILEQDQEQFKEKENNETRLFLSYIDNYINNSLHMKTQCEGKRLHVNTNILIKTLHDFGRKSFMTSFGFHCNQLPLRKGSIIKLITQNKHCPRQYLKLKFEIDYIFYNSRGISAKVNVYECKSKDDLSSKSIEEEKMSFPSRFIIHNIVMINNQETFYSMRHFFYEITNKSILDFVSQHKLSLLKKLSCRLDKHQS